MPQTYCISSRRNAKKKKTLKGKEGGILKKSRRSWPEVYVDQRDSALALKSGSGSRQEIQSSAYQDEISPRVTELSFD